MKRFFLFTPVVFFSSFLAATEVSNDISFGVGLGALYSGLGANVALVSDRDMKYISAGCVEYSSRYSFTCGFGLGWIVTDLFNSESNRHGWGIYVTKAGHESKFVFDGYNTPEFIENEYYGAGVSYTYFMNGINKPGLNFGISAHATNAKYEGKLNGFFQIGYQF